MQTNPNVENVLRGLQPGIAYHTNRWLIARHHDGSWWGVRDSCDEVSPRRFADIDDAIAAGLEWDVSMPSRVLSEALPVSKDLPMFNWLIRTMRPSEA